MRSHFGEERRDRILGKMDPIAYMRRKGDHTLGKIDAIASTGIETRSHFGDERRDRIHDTETRSHVG